MPELPEVETTLRGIEPHILTETIHTMTIRDHRLRWPIDSNIDRFIGKKILALIRRGKYMLLVTSAGSLIIHLGMSGRLRILTQAEPAKKHDHYDIEFSNKKILRYTDPRRFGALLWSEAGVTHPLLLHLGVEPLEKTFNAKYLLQACARKSLPIKSAIMDSKVVVGVGNIYAAEALYHANIHPLLPANKLSLLQIQQLVKAIKIILRRAIKQGGTTIRDFTNSEGKPGYFVQQLNVYGRAGMPCYRCETRLTLIMLAQRSTVYCEHCQKIKKGKRHV